jgi:hypothetical protein
VPGFFLPGVPGCQDALVADDQQGGGEQHEGCQAHQAAPAAADVQLALVIDQDRTRRTPANRDLQLFRHSQQLTGRQGAARAGSHPDWPQVHDR